MAKMYQKLAAEEGKPQRYLIISDGRGLPMTCTLEQIINRKSALQAAVAEVTTDIEEIQKL